MKQHKKRRVSVTMIFIGLVIIILLIFATITFYNKNPLAAQWTYTGRFTVLNTDSLSLVSYPSDKSSIITVTLPPDLYTFVPGGYGYYRIRDIHELGVSEGKGDQLLLHSISYLLGIPIETTYKSRSYWEQYRIWKLEQDTDVSTIAIDLSDYPIESEDTRTDGSIIERADPGKIDFYLEDTFWERAIRDENLALGVYNASGMPGIASDYTRLAEKVGFKVVDISNWEERFMSPCEVRVPSQEMESSVSIMRLAQMTSCLIAVGEVPERFDVLLIVSSDRYQ